VALAAAADAPSSVDADVPAPARVATVVREITPAGEAVRPFLNPLHTLAHLWRQRHLVRQLTARDLAARYRGSFLGIVWSLLVPMMMLALYTFVFSVVFRARWGVDENHKGMVALVLFAGLIPYNMFSEVVAVAPTLVVGNANYVKRVVFPLEILPLVKFLAAFVHALISAGVLVLAIVVARQTPPPTLVLMPIAWIPLVLLTLAVTYVFAALGVFVRDVGQAIAIVLPFIFFLTPIVYPPEAVPDRFAFVPWMNPIAHVVDDARRTAIFGMGLKWRAFAINCVLCGGLAFAGFLFFVKSKRAFHDAL
jgi:lipopolysaccharide transport system permease protein